MITSVARLLFPFSVILGAALLIKGYAAVGDGFAAGAVAALGAILQYAARSHDDASELCGARWSWRMICIGLVVTVAVALGPTFFGVAPVTHVPGPGDKVAHFGTLEFHTALLFDGGVAVLVYGALVATFDRILPPFVEDGR